MSIAESLTTISSDVTTLNGIKADIKAAINGKGGNVGDNMMGYATAISGLQTGGGDIVAISFSEEYTWVQPTEDVLLTADIPMVSMTAPS
jgi:hypothetical protein